MFRALPLIALASGCGRFGFDGGPDGGGDGTGDGSGSGNAYASAVMADHPIAYFRFDEPAGPTAHDMVGSRTGTYEGTFGFGEPGAVDGNPCVRFNGTDTRMPVGDVFPFGGNANYTLELWIKAVDIANTRFIIDRRTLASPSDGYTFYLGTDYFLAARIAADTEMAYVNSGALPLQTWVHAAVTYDGQRQRLYIDGALVQVSNATGANPIGSGPGAFTIGDSDPGQFRKLDAWLDEVAIYDTALPAARIAAHHAARP